MGTHLTEILNHNPKTQMRITMRAWVKDNDMTDFTSMLTYTADKFTPTGSLCYYKEKVDSEARSYQGRLLSKISIFGFHVSKIEKNGEQDYSPFGQSLVESEIALHSISTPPPSELVS